MKRDEDGKGHEDVITSGKDDRRIGLFCGLDRRNIFPAPGAFWPEVNKLGHEDSFALLSTKNLGTEESAKPGRAPVIL